MTGPHDPDFDSELWEAPTGLLPVLDMGRVGRVLARMGMTPEVSGAPGSPVIVVPLEGVYGSIRLIEGEPGLLNVRLSRYGTLPHTELGALVLMGNDWHSEQMFGTVAVHEVSGHDGLVVSVTCNADFLVGVTEEQLAVHLRRAFDAGQLFLARVAEVYGDA